MNIKIKKQKNFDKNDSESLSELRLWVLNSEIWAEKSKSKAWQKFVRKNSESHLESHSGKHYEIDSESHSENPSESHSKS